MDEAGQGYVLFQMEAFYILSVKEINNMIWLVI